jgi:hypothetical protein
MPGDDATREIADLARVLEAQTKALNYLLARAALARHDLDHARLQIELHGPGAPVSRLLDQARCHLEAIAKRLIQE